MLLAYASTRRRPFRDGYVSYNGNDYSVPESTSVPEVTVAATLDQARFYYGAELIAGQPLMEGKGQCQLDPNHRGSKRNSRDKDSATMDSAELIEMQRRPLEDYEGVPMSANATVVAIKRRLANIGRPGQPGDSRRPAGKLDSGAISPAEAVERLLAAHVTLRNERRLLCYALFPSPRRANGSIPSTSLSSPPSTGTGF